MKKEQSAIVRGVIVELTAKLLPLFERELSDCILISINRAAGLLDLNSQSTLRVLTAEGLLVDLGNRKQRVRLSDVHTLIERRSVKKTRNPKIKD